MKIARVYFDETIPIDLQHRSPMFEAETGWQITEEEPGRVRLQLGGLVLTVQDYGYTLHYEPEAPSFEGIELQGEAGPLKVIPDPTHSELLTGVSGILTTEKEARKRGRRRT